MRIRSEKIERNKVNMILASLVSQATDIVKIRQIITDNKAARLSQPA
jgi:pyruvate kinase